MRFVWIAGMAVVAAMNAAAQTTIYKLVDESGRVTYSNKPMKGATVMDLEPLTLVPATPVPPPAAPQPAKPAAVATVERLDTPKADVKPALAATTTLAAIEPQLQRKRDNDRRRILEDELQREEQSLTEVRDSLSQEQQNPMLVAAVRAAQQANEPTAQQALEMRNNIEKASSRIRGLQATAAEHEKNIEALKKELGALKP
ncbi:MAG TPA: DUF4124 domain-containing protein [Usitatibacter sp.]|nr:DUF4124 domain-containing protein [Usitatibacter sp.]